MDLRGRGEKRGGGAQGIEGLGFSWRGRGRKGETYTAIFRPSAAVAVAVEARHGRLGEEGEGFAEDFYVTSRN